MKYENYDRIKEICKKIDRCNKILDSYEEIGRKRLCIEIGTGSICSIWLNEPSDDLSELAQSHASAFIGAIRTKIKEYNVELEQL